MPVCCHFPVPQEGVQIPRSARNDIELSMTPGLQRPLILNSQFLIPDSGPQIPLQGSQQTLQRAVHFLGVEGALRGLEI